MISAIASFAVGILAAGSALAQGTVKVGLVVSMTGEQASTGRQVKAGVDLYMKEHGNKVAGKTIQVIIRDSGSVPDNTKRLAQELIVNGKVNVIAGFEITPAALVVAQLATEAKVVEVVMAAGTSIITERSPYIVRTSDTVPQSSVIIADWAAKNRIKKVVTIVSDYAPSLDA
jgi:branched-chain amino acid transport system substrate-binding protein